MLIEYCETCGKLKLSYHRCGDKYEVCFTQWDGEWDSYQTVYADSYEDAVEQAAEQDDCHGDYSIIKQGGTDNIFVRKVDSDEDTKIYECTAEMVARYDASEKILRNSGTSQ